MGKALMVSGSEVVNHLNNQRQDIFFPDENTTVLDRLGACAEVGFGASAVAVPAALVGSWAIGALGGGTALAETGGAAAAAACADGDCTNEVEATQRIVNKGWTVIGKFPAYLDKAKELGANVFNIAADEWKALGSRAAQWAKNVEFLDEAIARGDSFRLATDFALGWAEKGTFYKDELVYLLQKGYELVLQRNVGSLN